MFSFSVKTRAQQELVDITPQIRSLAEEHGGQKKLCVVYIPHTTAAVTINENADPDVKRDIIYGLNQMVPDNLEYRHGEGNSLAHIKASLMGSSQTLLIENGKIKLGTWQGVFLAEFDGPRNRCVMVAFV
ncbi:MAG: secondary thiamine-phosphate synthase enzyme YjbQ [Syntrophomonas sp.]